MNEEEKKAIDHIKNIKSWWWNNSPGRIYSINKEDIEQFDIVLNLIDKQSKEIDKQEKVIKEYETLLKKQEKLEQEKDILKKQGWL